MCAMGGKYQRVYVAGVGCPRGVGRSRGPLSGAGYRLRTLECMIKRFNFFQEIIRSYYGCLRMRVA